MTNQDLTTEKEPTIRKDTLELALKYNGVYNFVRFGIPVARIMGIVSMIISVLLFIILPKWIGIIILIIAIVDLIYTNPAEMHKAINELHELRNELKQRQDIIDDIIAHPVVERSKEYNNNLIKSKTASLELLIMGIIVCLATDVMLLVGWMAAHIIWLLVMFIACIMLTVFFIRKAAQVSRRRKQYRHSQDYTRTDEFIDISTSQLVALKRCKERLSYN